jgi:protein-L-isoaspartate O-methyltransferase
MELNMLDIQVTDVLVILFLSILVLAVIRLVPYVPARPAKVGLMTKLAGIKAGERAVDLGSGDGRIVIAFARAGAQAHGFEINPALVILSRLNILRAGLKGRAFIHWKSFRGQDFSAFSVVAVYGLPHIMKNLEAKLRKELKPGARVVSLAFPFPSWRHFKKEESVYLYILS